MKVRRPILLIMCLLVPVLSSAAASAPAAYVLGPGDELLVDIWGATVSHVTATIPSVIYMAGGVKDGGSVRNITLYRHGGKVALQAELKVKNDAPVLSAAKPVSVPMQKSNSLTKTLAIWVFLGIIVSCGSVFGLDWLRTQELDWPKNW